MNIEKWLKTKFREGFRSMNTTFAQNDPNNLGRVNRKVFRQVLGKFGLHLRDDNALNALLSRCGILEPGDVNYKQFLHRFQDRSDQGKHFNRSTEKISFI